MKPTNLIGILFCMLSLISIVSAFESQKIYFLDLEYDEGALKMLNKNLITGFPTVSNDNTLSYKLELLSFEKELLFEGYFEIPNVVFVPVPLDPNETSGPIELDNINFSISVPHNEIGSLIKISKDGKELLSIDVSEFSKYCGDSKCQYTENHINCPQDCASGAEDYYCDEIEDNICDPDCEVYEDIDCSSELYGYDEESSGLDGETPLKQDSELNEDKELDKKSNLPLIGGISFLIIIIISGVLIYSKMRSSSSTEEKDILKLKPYIINSGRKGYSKQQITQTLLKRGWNNKIIEKAFKFK